MILLDTDHCTVLFDQRHRLHHFLNQKLAEANQEITIPVVSIEEQLRGFLAYIHREREFHKQCWPYSRLCHLLEALSQVTIVDFDDSAAREAVALKSQKLHIGTQDLKIAAIALTHHALLVSNNLKDFKRIPGLRVESWII